MNARRGFTKYSPRVALAGLGVLAWTGLATAQVTFSAANVTGNEGETVAVPITVTLGGTNLAFFAVTFAVAQGGAPPVTDELTYEPAPGVPAPDLQTAVASQAKLAIGYAGVTIQPALAGRAQVGTLMVPIPFGGAGSSYQVQMARISAGDSAGKKLTVVAQPGMITVTGQAGSAPGGNPPVGSQGAAPPVVEAPGAGSRSQVQAPGAAPTTARASGAAPFNAAAAVSPAPTAPEAAAPESTPQLPAGGQGAITPGQVPGGQAPVGQAPAGQAPAGQVPAPTGAATGAAAEAVGTSTRPISTPTAAKTTAAAPVATAAKKVAPPAAQAAATPETKTGCQLATEPTRQSGGWFLVAPIALLLLRRRH